MAHVNKDEIITRVAKNVGISKRDAKIIVPAVFEAVSYYLTHGMEVWINELGRFRILYREPRRYRDRQSGELVMSKGKNYVKFNISRLLKDAVAKTAPVEGKK